MVPKQSTRTKILIILTSIIFLASCGLHKNRHDAPTAKPFDGKAQFSSIYEGVFASKCIECHERPTKKNHMVDLSSYEAIMAFDQFPPLIAFDQNNIPIPEESSLYTSILNGDMPKDKPLLSKKEITAIFEWIKKGAPKVDTPETPTGGKPGGGEPGGGEPGDDEPGDDGPKNGGSGTGEPGSGGAKIPNEKIKKLKDEPCDRKQLAGEPGIIECFK